MLRLSAHALAGVYYAEIGALTRTFSSNAVLAIALSRMLRCARGLDHRVMRILSSARNGIRV